MGSWPPHPVFLRQALTTAVASVVAGLIIALNGFLLYGTFFG